MCVWLCAESGGDYWFVYVFDPEKATEINYTCIVTRKATRLLLHGSNSIATATDQVDERRRTARWTE